MDGTIFVFDFDGVVCDSLDECLVSSWTAYFTLLRREQPVLAPLSLRKDFARLRPFIRSGEDYMVIQEILHSRLPVSTQGQFDEIIRKTGPKTMALYRELFMRARTELLSRDRPYWLSLNRIYPHMFTAFIRLPPEAPVHILSTKMPQFIREILGNAGINIPAARIHFCSARQKLSRVESLRALGGFGRATFIDDQIDHLKNNTNPMVDVRLASWGYVKPEWLDGRDGVPIIDPEGLLSLIERVFGKGGTRKG